MSCKCLKHFFRYSKYDPISIRISNKVWFGRELDVAWYLLNTRTLYLGHILNFQIVLFRGQETISKSRKTLKFNKKLIFIIINFIYLNLLMTYYKSYRYWFKNCIMYLHRYYIIRNIILERLFWFINLNNIRYIFINM